VVRDAVAPADGVYAEQVAGLLDRMNDYAEAAASTIATLNSGRESALAGEPARVIGAHGLQSPRVRLFSLRAIAHPLRLQILPLLTGTQLSAAEVGRELDTTQANPAASWFATLADPTRVRIVQALSLADELCVCDLAASTGTMSPSPSSRSAKAWRRGAATTAERLTREVRCSRCAAHRWRRDAPPPPVASG
jgi:DNA-binding transcriptional ArsR family regulator